MGSSLQDGVRGRHTFRSIHRTIAAMAALTLELTALTAVNAPRALSAADGALGAGVTMIDDKVLALAAMAGALSVCLGALALCRRGE